MAARKTPEVPTVPAPVEAPETTHRFTSDTSLIFPDLHHPDPDDPDRPGVHVVRKNPVLDNEGNPEPEVGNVVLHPGDEVTLPIDYEHAWLQLINPPAPDTNAEQPAPEINTEELS